MARLRRSPLGTVSLASLVAAAASASDETPFRDVVEGAGDRVRVRFYGESQCPFCRRFVTDAWNALRSDPEFRPVLDYDFVPWGNAYFATEECGVGPYRVEERRCWYEKCAKRGGDGDGGGGGGGRGDRPVAPPPTPRGADLDHPDDVDDCFSGPAVYQHSAKEGRVDVYESCVREILGLDSAVSFAYCCEGPNMDDPSLPDARSLMERCVDPPFEAGPVHRCMEERGRDIEVANARRTPPHPGVPYVTVDGVALDDAMGVMGAVCDRLRERGIDRPSACGEEGAEVEALKPAGSGTALCL